MRDVWEIDWDASTKTLDVHLTVAAPQARRRPDPSQVHHDRPRRRTAPRVRLTCADRLLAAFVIVAAATVVALGVPLAIIGRSTARNEAVQRADREADGIALTIITRLRRGEQVDPALLAPFAIDGHYVEVVTPDGRSVTAGTRPRDDTVDATISSGGTTVHLRVPDGDVDRRQALVVIVVGALGALAVALAAGVGVALSRRLTRPLDELAAAARRLGDGDLSARATMTGLGEVDAVAATLNKGAAQIEQIVAAERRFSANAFAPVAHPAHRPADATRGDRRDR